MLADSHCHLDRLDLTDYNHDFKLALKEARAQGIKYLLAPSISLESAFKILEIVQSDPYLFAAIGVHPTEKDLRFPKPAEILEHAQHHKVVAIGETGLDFCKDSKPEDIKRQLELFKLHIKAAKELSKPLIIHSRNADSLIIETLIEEQAKAVGGVIHCFTGTLEMAQKAVELGFFISFSGIITFKNATELRKIAKAVPLNKVMIETDAPYLAPVPLRGKPNQPAYLIHTAAFLSKHLDISFEMFENTTTENFLAFIKR